MQKITFLYTKHMCQSEADWMLFLCASVKEFFPADPLPPDISQQQKCYPTAACLQSSSYYSGTSLKT